MSGNGHLSTTGFAWEPSSPITRPRALGEGLAWSPVRFERHLDEVSERQSGEVIDYNLHLASDRDLFDTHELYAGPDGMVYFTQRMHDRVGRITLDGRVELFSMPDGSRPHGLRFDSQGRWYVSLENLDQLVELSRDDGSILKSYNVAFDDSEVGGVVGPHGFAIDAQDRLWYTGRASDVLGRVDTRTDQHERFFLPTFGLVSPNHDHEWVKPAASAPINIELDSRGNAWFVNLQTNQIGRVSAEGELDLFGIEGFASGSNTRPINIFEGPDGLIWLTVEGDNSNGYPSGSLPTLGGFARFDPSQKRFLAYQQNRSKGAGGSLGVASDTLWFEYQEQALVEVNVDHAGRRSQRSFDLPEVGQRVMHRIGQGPDGNIWFTSLAKDLISVLVTEQQGLPVYHFADQSHGMSYLSALPQEWTNLQREGAGSVHQSPLFLSACLGEQASPVWRFLDEVTGQTLWTADASERDVWTASADHRYEGEDFLVYDEAQDREGLIPIYRGVDRSTGHYQWFNSLEALDAASHADAEIAWYALPIPERAAFPSLVG